MSINMGNTPEMYSMTTSGTFTFNTNCRVRNTPYMSDEGVATYDSGTSVNYDEKLFNDGHLWLSYIATSGIRHYVPYANVSDGVYFGSDSNPGNPIETTPATTSSTSTLGDLTGPTGAAVASQTPDGTSLMMSGSFKFDEEARGRNADEMSATKGDTFNAGDTVYYDKKIKNDNHYWLVYSHYGSGTYYVPYATIDPYRIYGTDDNPGDPVYSQSSTTTPQTPPASTTTTGNNTGNTTTATGARDHTGQETELEEQTSTDTRTYIGEGYHYPCKGYLTLTSNAMGRETPNMVNSVQTRKYTKQTRIHYTHKLFADGHLWVVLDNGQYLPVSTITHYESTLTRENDKASYSYVVDDTGEANPFEELWPNTSNPKFFDHEDVGANDSSYLNVTDINLNDNFTPSNDELNAMQQLADNINATADNESVSIAYMADTHFDSYKTPGTARVLHSLQLMSYFAKNYGVDLVVHGGDLNDGVKPLDISEEDIARAVDAIKECQRPFIILQGNHDDNSGYSRDESSLDSTQIIWNVDGNNGDDAYSYRVKWFNQWLNIPTGNDNPHNAVFGTYHVPNSNIVVIVLDGFDMPDVQYPTREQVRHGHTDYSPEQVTWLQNTLNEIGPDQQIVVFDHIALNGIQNWSVSDTSEWFENSPFKSYQPGLVRSNEVYQALVAHQNANQNILGFFAGHIHQDANALSDGIQFSTITCGLADRGIGEGSRQIGTLSENGWEVIQINPTRHQIYQYRLPGGHVDEDGFLESWQI